MRIVPAWAWAWPGSDQEFFGGRILTTKRKKAARIRAKIKAYERAAELLMQPEPAAIFGPGHRKFIAEELRSLVIGLRTRLMRYEPPES